MANILDQNGAIYIKNLVPPEFCQFFTHVLLKKSDFGPSSDALMTNVRAMLPGDLMFETLLERLWPVVESIIGEELIPTYTYARLYSNNDELTKHTDRDACEVSLTIQLGRSHNYTWPIYAGNQRFDLAEGDAVLYKGCDVEHWRKPCDGPDGYYSGQAFLHYVKKNGTKTEFAKDKRQDVIFEKNRTFLMESK